MSLSYLDKLKQATIKAEDAKKLVAQQQEQAARQAQLDTKHKLEQQKAANSKESASEKASNAVDSAKDAAGSVKDAVTNTAGAIGDKVTQAVHDVKDAVTPDVAQPATVPASVGSEYPAEYNVDSVLVPTFPTADAAHA